MKRYKLIKEYPGSPKLNDIVEQYKNGNYISTCRKYSINPILIENATEFWEEIIDRDYEILSFINNDTESIVELHDNSKYCYKGSIYYKGIGELELNDCLHDKCLSIYQIKRLSDSAIFTVGDKILVGEKREAIIGSFGFMVEGDTKMWAHYLDLDGTHRGSTVITNITHFKEPLFTTEDGVKVYEKNHPKLFYLNLFDFSIGEDEENSLIIPDTINYKYFLTREKAEEYIYWNEPVLTLNDVATIYKGLTYLRDNTPQKPGQQALDLLELVKSKYE